MLGFLPAMDSAAFAKSPIIDTTAKTNTPRIIVVPHSVIIELTKRAHSNLRDTSAPARPDPRRNSETQNAAHRFLWPAIGYQRAHTRSWHARPESRDRN